MHRIVMCCLGLSAIFVVGCDDVNCVDLCNTFTYCGPQQTMYDKCIMRCENGFFESECLDCADYGAETEGACRNVLTCANQNCLAWQVGSPAIDQSVRDQACANPPPNGTPNANTTDCGIWRELIAMCAGDDSQSAAGEAVCKESYNSPECTDCLDLNNCTDLLACNVLNCRWTIMAGCTFPE